MCGRYNFEPGDRFYERFEINNRLDFLPKSFNASPGQVMPVVTHQDSNLVRLMKWGLIPFWAKDDRIGRNLFNARAESITDKPAFRKAYQNRRCLIPANGFYEWKFEGNRKVPYFFTLDRRPLFAFAGLYDIWVEPAGGKEIYSYTIITTLPNDIVKPIHDRMPVILKPKDEPLWLDQSVSPAQLQPLLRPSPEILSVSRSEQN